MNQKPTVNWIKGYADSLEKYYAKLRQNQQEAEQYYNDEFAVGITPPYHIVRTGRARKMVDTISENITSTNPQVTREPRKKNAAETERANKVSRLCNHWVKLLIQEIMEGIRYAPLRGEGYFQVEYLGDKKRPIIITAPDPMSIFPDPVETNGIPVRAVKMFETTVGAVKQRFPKWFTTKNLSETVKYLAYWDEDWRYVEADDVPIIDVQKNIFGVVPIVHFYSGFGRTGMDVKPEDKAVDKLRAFREVLKEECELESRIDSIIGLWANPVAMINAIEDGVEITAEEARNVVSFAPGRVNVIPKGWKVDVIQGAQPSSEMFGHLNMVRAQLELEIPPVTSGVASGSRSSGRLEDILGESFKNKYRRIIFNVQEALGTAMGMALQIADKVPGVMPLTITTVQKVNGQSEAKEETITKDDIDGYYDVSVELKPEDPLDNDRKAMLGSRMLSAGEIDPETNLIDFKGYTPERARQILVDTLKWRVLLNSPDIVELIGLRAAEASGMLQDLQMLKQRKASLEQGVGAGGGMPSSKQGSRASEVKTPQGMEMIDMSLTQRGARTPPSNYQGGA